MKSKEIFIHVGMPKTGTTFLQRNIFTQIQEVRYFDLSDKLYSSIFKDFFFQNITIHTLSKLKKDLENLLVNTSERKILISDESWFGSTLGGSHFNFSNNYYLTLILRELFPAAKIILTIRKQDKWLESMYRHILREGYSIGINNFLNYKYGTFNNYISCFRKGPNINIKVLEYFPYIENYTNLFGKSNVLVLPQEMLIQNEAEFLKKISEFIQCKFNKSLNHLKLNTGYLYGGSIIAIILNRFFIFKGRNGGIFPTSNSKFLNFQSYIRLIDRIIPIRKNFINKKKEQKIKEYFNNSNALIDLRLNLQLKKYNYYD